jgi:sugar-specific transcriptional regulator TrmB
MAINVKLQLDLTQSLPLGVKEPLRKHEETHCAMTAEVYKQAPQIATEIARRMIGRKIVVQSNGNENAAEADAEFQAAKDFKGEYKKAVSNEADEAAKIFDRITNHGLNSVTNEDGSRRSFEELRSQKHEGEKKNGS